jgi:hypothetical protein
LLSRLYIWSIVFEPLLFFIFFQRSLVGIPGNFSRMLQILVFIYFVLKIIIKHKIRIINFTSSLYIFFSTYFLLLIFAGLIGLASGAYDLPGAYQQGETLSGFSKMLNSAAIRPIFEYIIAGYYIIYFAVFPKYILKTEKDIIKFFKVFKLIFIISFVIGFVDLIFSAFLHVDLVPRHIMDGINVGARYHGLAGEPRHAVPYLALGLAIFHLQYFFEGKKLNNWWIIAVIIAMLLTQSASGILGIVAFIALYIIFNLINLRQFLKLFFLLMLVTSLLYLAVISSDRITNYIESAKNLWFILESGGELPYLMKIQLDSIYPLYDLTVKFRNFDILPVLIGSGLGSASVANNVYTDVVFGTSNPNSQLVRTLYESGLIGTWIFILAFIKPIKSLVKNFHARVGDQFIMYMFLLVGCTFGVRSAVAYIYIGILIATFNVLGQNLHYRKRLSD